MRVIPDNLLSFKAFIWLGGGGGAEINFGRGTKSLFMWIREGQGGTRNLFQCGSNEQGEDQKKVFSSKIFTNCSYRLKILAIFHEFLSEDQKKKRSSSCHFVSSSHFGGHGPGMPRRGAGPELIGPIAYHPGTSQCLYLFWKEYTR